MSLYINYESLQILKNISMHVCYLYIMHSSSNNTVRSSVELQTVAIYLPSVAV